jgi:hypothetical protein
MGDCCCQSDAACASSSSSSASSSYSCSCIAGHCPASAVIDRPFWRDGELLVSCAVALLLCDASGAYHGWYCRCRVMSELSRFCVRRLRVRIPYYYCWCLHGWLFCVFSVILTFPNGSADCLLNGRNLRNIVRREGRMVALPPIFVGKIEMVSRSKWYSG